MRHLGLYSILIVVVLLAGCGLESKLNNKGGFVKFTDDKLEVVKFETSKESGKVILTEYDLYDDGDGVFTIGESTTEYDVVVNDKGAQIKGLIPVDMTFEKDQLIIHPVLFGEKEVYEKSSKKQTDKLIKSFKDRAQE